LNGSTYGQVRAIGGSTGYSDGSDPVSHMSMYSGNMDGERYPVIDQKPTKASDHCLMAVVLEI
jgi:hypothetical protein